MDLKLLEIRYKNIREFKDITIPLASDERTPYKNTLIQMPTGTGKTTTMKLIRYALDGTATQADKEEIQSFRPLFPTQETDGEFEVKMLLDGDIIYSTMTFDFESGAVKYFTTSTKLGGKTRGHNLGAEAKSILSPSFVRLFVFDGEVAAAIKDIRKNEAENAIKTLFYLDKISSINRTIDEVVEERQQNAQHTGVKTPQGIKLLQTKLEKARDVKKNLIKEKNEMEEEIEECKKRIESIEEELERLGKRDETLKKRIMETQNKINELKNKLKVNADELLFISRNPINISDDIATRLQYLGSIMTAMKLPKTTSKEFFDLLIEQSECICGRKLEEEHKKIIQKKAEEFLTEDQIGVINALKQSLRGIPSEINKINESVEKARAIQRELQKQKTAYDSLINQRNAGIDPELLESLEKEKHKCILNIHDLESERNIVTLEDPAELKHLEWKDNISLCEKHIQDLERQLQEATGTVDFSKKAQLLKSIISDIVSKSLEGLKEQIKDNTNKKIKQILKRDDLTISDITNSIIISDREDVSEGQKLSIAYAFLSSLFEQSYHHLPFIVDSPAVSIDLSVRKEVAALIPPLFEQCVMFLISSEKEGFGNTFYRKEDTQFLTIYKDEDTPGLIHLSDDQDFFDNFQSESENEWGEY